MARYRRPRTGVAAALASTDAYALTLIRGACPSALERVAVPFTHAGRGGLVWFGLATVIGSGRRPLRGSEGAAVSIVAIGSALLVSTALARVIARPRPCDRGFRSLVPCPGGASFPSDQTAAAAAAVEILGWLAPSRRPSLVGTAATLAVARIVAGVHYPTDVIAGGMLGASIGRAAKAIASRRASFDDTNLEAA